MNFSPTEKDVVALLTFLSDSSEQTVALAKEHLRQILRQNPAYKNLLENPSDPLVVHEARAFLEETRLEDLKSSFQQLAAQGRDLDLERGAIALCQIVYPSLQPQNVSRMLDHMAAEIKKDLDLQEASTTREVSILRRYLFDQQGFGGNEGHYYDPDNSFINRVLERKMGIPISLSCLYLFLAQRLDMTAFGIGLPGHFIVGHRTASGIVYVDPYRRGQLLTRDDCVEIVRQRGMAFQDAFLAPTPNHQILTRMIANLVNVYTEQRQLERAQWLTQILALFDND